MRFPGPVSGFSTVGKLVLGILAGMACSGLCSLIVGRAQADVAISALLAVLLLKVIAGLFLCITADYVPVGAGLFASIPLEFLIFLSQCFRAFGGHY